MSLPASSQSVKGFLFLLLSSVTVNCVFPGDLFLHGRSSNGRRADDDGRGTASRATTAGQASQWRAAGTAAPLGTSRFCFLFVVFAGDVVRNLGGKMSGQVFFFYIGDQTLDRFDQFSLSLWPHLELGQL